MTDQSLFERLHDLLSLWITFPGSGIVITLILLLSIAVCSVGGYYLTNLLLRLVTIVVEKTETDWDDDLINAKLLRAISHLTPAIIIAILLPLCFSQDTTFSHILHLLTSFYIIWVSVYAANTFLDNLFFAFLKRKRFKPYAVKGIFQMGKLIFIGMGIIIAISLLVERSPVAILTTLGASAAILMLVFKDTIMGLVASVQLTANKMVQRGDWIVVPKNNANGEVIEISLTTVKIRNWDNSVTTVPPYSLVSDSFQNFQAMKRSGARRLCRHVFIDLNSVRFLTPKEKDALPLPQLPAPADSTPKESPVGQGSTTPADTTTPTEGGSAGVVNLAIFREYLEGWLAVHPDVRSDMMYMVRQLEPTPSGLPLELYCFLSTTDWKGFERIQSSIFDHVYAVAPLFGLQLYQAPSGRDVLALAPES